MIGTMTVVGIRHLTHNQVVTGSSPVVRGTFTVEFVCPKQNPIDRGGHFTQMVDLTRGILWISPKVRFLL